MRTLILAAALAVSCLAMSGCFTYDEEHDRFHTRVFERDIMIMHEDFDFLLGWDEESPLEIWMR